MGFFKKIFSFFGGVLKQVLVKIITFALIVIIIIVFIKYFFKIDVISLFGL